MRWYECAITHECPSELGRCDLPKVGITNPEEHWPNATIPYLPPIGARFDDPNLVSCAGLVPVMGVGAENLPHAVCTYS